MIRLWVPCSTRVVSHKNEITPLTSAQLESYCSVGNTFAMTDVDIINVPDPTVSWWIDLPKKPVHGPVRNELYFDWHVGTKPIAY